MDTWDTGLTNRRVFHLEELFSIGLVMALNLLILLYSSVQRAPLIFAINTALLALMIAVPFIQRAHPDEWLYHARNLYIILIGGFVYFEHHYLVPLVNPHDIDELLINIDRYLFMGNDPTVLLESFTLPILTEFLEIAYVSYYLLPTAFMLLLYFKGKRLEFHASTAMILLSLYICYLGYYAFPAIGPRFTLDHLQSMPLSGLFTYDYIRTMILEVSGVTRDCCPSGHTFVSMTTALLAYRYLKPFFKTAFVWASLIVVSTVYLRYHYVIDVIAGLILAMTLFRLTPHLVNRYVFMAEKPAGLVAEDAKSSTF